MNQVDKEELSEILTLDLIFGITDTDTCVNKLIELYTIPVIKSTNRFKSYYRNLSDDIEGVALLEMVKAIRKAPLVMTDLNIFPYILTRTQGAVRNFLAERGCLHCTRGTKKEQPIQILPKQDMSTFGTIDNRIIEKVHYKDLISHLSDDDQRIIQMRVEGYTLAEIGKIFGLTPDGVKKRHNRISLQLRSFENEAATKGQRPDSCV